MPKQSFTSTRAVDVPVRRGWSLPRRPFTDEAAVSQQRIEGGVTCDSGSLSSVRTFRYEPTESAAATPIQSKLRLGLPGDEYEQQADCVAKTVVADLSGGGNGTRQPVPKIRPVFSNCGTTNVAPEVEADVERSRGRGERLPPSVRAPLERAFGVDFSGVRVHADTHANQLSRSIQAEAFTCGNDIYLAGGGCEWGTGPRRELLLHELTHVAQQNAAAQMDAVSRSSISGEPARTSGLIQRAFRSFVPSSNKGEQQEDDFRTSSGHRLGSVGASYPNFEFGGYFLEDHLGSSDDDALERSEKRPGTRGEENTVVLSTEDALQERIQDADANKLTKYQGLFELKLRCEFVNVVCRLGAVRAWSSYGTYDSDVTFKGVINKKTLTLTGIKSADTRRAITWRSR